MARGRPLPPLTVSPDVREEFASLARSRSLPAGLVSARPDRAAVRRGPGQYDGGRAGRRQPPDGRPVARALPHSRASWACTTNTGRDGRAPSRTRHLDDCCCRRRWRTRPPDGRHALDLPHHGRGHRGVEVHGAAHLDRVRHPAPPAEALPTLHRSLLCREGPRHRRPLSQPARPCPGPVRRREEPDPGLGAHPAPPAPRPRLRRGRDARLHPSRHHHPSSPPWTSPLARSSPSTGRATATKSSWASSDTSMPTCLRTSMSTSSSTTTAPISMPRPALARRPAPLPSPFHPHLRLLAQSSRDLVPHLMDYIIRA